MRDPRIPMTPQQIPQQGVYIPVGAPWRPERFDVAVGYDERSLPEDAQLKRPPRKAHYLFQAEWAWSPMNNRLSAFYLHRGRRYWSIFDRAYDEDGPQSRWQWYQRAVVPLRQASAKQAAFWLMVELMKFDHDEAFVEEWHWIGEAGELGIAETKAIAHIVWGGDWGAFTPRVAW
ncbi:MAG: hypothetical protein KIS68_02850 [Bauldia sp.]|nr:hypothetical protein [Bauldia sp.]